MNSSHHSGDGDGDDDDDDDDEIAACFPRNAEKACFVRVARERGRESVCVFFDF